MRSPVGSRPRHGVIDIQAEGFFNLPRPTIYRYTLCIQCISYRKGSSSCLLNGQCDAMRLLQTAPFWPDCSWMHIRLIRDPEWMCGLGLIHGTKKAWTWSLLKGIHHPSVDLWHQKPVYSNLHNLVYKKYSFQRAGESWNVHLHKCRQPRCPQKK